MRSPKDMKTIQIELTNACIHSCSNCTRMCGHHKKNFFMDWHTFKRAVDSLEGFEGTVGIMGGEPTLHPEFERFVMYVNEKFGVPKKDNALIKPTNTFMRTLLLETREKYKEYNATNEKNQVRIKGPGLWSSLCGNYYKHYELIQDVFEYQCLNDHQNISYHQPVMVTRKELGIEDEEWFKLRDACWIQNTWSASITPKGAFFCEIAAALDMLFDGPGGWPIEKDWWKREPKDFTEQLHWCELCGIALDTKSRNANEEIDDISPKMYEKIKSIDSPKVKQGKINIYSESEESIKQNGELDKIRKGKYTDSDFNRLSDKNTNIYPKGFNGIVFYNKEIPYESLLSNINNNLSQLDSMVVIVNDDNVYAELGTKLSKKKDSAFVVNSNSYGKAINRAFSYFNKQYFTLILSPNIILNNNFKDYLSKFVINPGTLHYNIFSNNQESGLNLISLSDILETNLVLLFNTNSYALKLAGYDGINKCNDLNEFKNLWSDKKQIVFDDKMFESNDKEIEIVPNECYVVYGTGEGGKKVTEAVNNIGSTIRYYCDSNEEKWGKEFLGKKIISPNELLEKRKEYDRIIIASIALIEIRNTLLQLGFTNEDFVSPLL